MGDIFDFGFPTSPSEAASTPAGAIGAGIGEGLACKPSILSCSDRCSDKCLPVAEKFPRVLGEDPFLACYESCNEHCSEPSSPKSCGCGK